MASISYHIRSKSKNTSVYLRFRTETLSAILRTPYKINSKYWSTAKHRLKTTYNTVENDKQNARLNKLKKHFINNYNNDVSKIEIDLNWAKLQLSTFFKKNNDEYKIYLNDYFQYYIDKEKPNDKKFSIIKNSLKPKTKFSEINKEWIESFINDKIEKGYSENYVGKQIQLIRRVLKHAIEEINIDIPNKVFTLKKPSRDPLEVYLDEKELQLLFDEEFDSERLNNVKKQFLIGCTTGLRISDLKKKHIIKDGFIEVRTQKTGQLISIPIDPRVESFFNDIRPISDSKFNLYIKEIFELLKFNELNEGYIFDGNKTKKYGIYPKYKLISSHTMRRSFASNLYGKIPTVVIMAITGHTTEKSFLTYIKKPQKDHAIQLKKYYEKKNKPVKRNL